VVTLHAIGLASTIADERVCCLNNNKPKTTVCLRLYYDKKEFSLKVDLKSGHKGFILIAIFGIILIVAGVIYQIVTDRKFAEWPRTDAKVVAYAREIGSDVDSVDGWVYYEIFEYTVDGKVYKVRSRSHSSVPPILGVSDKIAYNPKNPRDFIEVNEGIPVEIFLYIIGGLLTCAGVVLFLISSRKRSTASE